MRKKAGDLCAVREPPLASIRSWFGTAHSLRVAAEPFCSSPPVLTRFKRSAGGDIVALNAF